MTSTASTAVSMRSEARRSGLRSGPYRHAVADTIIRLIFAAGLSLQNAAGLITNPEVRWRIEAAVSELDEVIRETRNVVFQKAQDSDSRGPSQDILDLSAQLATTASVHISGRFGDAPAATDLAEDPQLDRRARYPHQRGCSC